MGLLEGLIIGAVGSAVGAYNSAKAKKQTQEIIEELSKHDYPKNFLLSGNSPTDLYKNEKLLKKEEDKLKDRDVRFFIKLSGLKTYDDLIAFIDAYEEKDMKYLFNNINQQLKLTKEYYKLSFAFVKEYIVDYIELVKSTNCFENVSNKTELIQTIENKNMELAKETIISTIKEKGLDLFTDDIPGANKAGLAGIVWAVNYDYTGFNALNFFENITYANLAVKTVFRKRVNQIAKKI